MDRKSIPSFNQLVNPHLLLIFWILSIILHGLSYFMVIANQQYLLNDSVIYLTMAKNFQNYGVISQSFFEPILPDFQRSPLYPIFLSFFSIKIILALQHVFILLTGYLLQKLSYNIYSTPSFLKYLGVFFTLMPYSLNLPSLILSESLFVFFFTLASLFFIHFFQNSKWFDLIFSAIFIIICAYIRASILPFILWFMLAIFVYHKSYWNTIFFSLLILIGIFPWMYRNFFYTHQWIFTSASQISTSYGRIGGTILAFDNNFNNDPYLKVNADEFIQQYHSLQTIKKYYHEVINEENEFIQVPLSWIYLKQHFTMPVHAVFFHLRCIYQQMTGLSYGMSIYLYQNQYIAILMAFMQALFILIIYGLFAYSGFTTTNKKLWILWFIGLLLWLFIHNAAWADGRYRYVTDLWCILGIIVLNQGYTSKYQSKLTNFSKF